jgi:hypothetical protein
MREIVAKLRAMSGPIRPNVVFTAADFIESVQWRRFSDERPMNYSRILVHRKIGQYSYVDAANYIEESESGLKPLANMAGVVHWMPIPAPPLQE